MRRLKVLQLITRFAVGGATEITIAICRYLDQDRFESRILCGKERLGEATMHAQAADAKVSVVDFHTMVHPVRPVPDFRAYKELLALCRRERFDVVHTHGSKAGIVGRRAAFDAGVPVIVHYIHGWGHHNHMHPMKRRLYVQAERWVAPLTDRFIAAANANIVKGLADGIGRRDQYETVYCGIDFERFTRVSVDQKQLKTSLGIPVDAPVVGTVGRLVPQKAPDDWLKMAELIRAKRTDAHFIILGDGPLMPEFLAGVKAAGMDDCVHALGHREDVHELLRVFDIFTLSSLWEGLPRVFAQAMCASLPIIATNVDGAAEAITEGENGHLVPPKQPQLLADHVLRLIENPAQRRAMGERGRKIVASQFTERNMVRRLEEIYSEIATKKGLSSHRPIGERRHRTILSKE